MRDSLIVLITLIACIVVPTGCGGDARSPERTMWRCTVAINLGTKLGGCAIGDVDPRYPGNEIVAVGGDGAVHVVRHANGKWIDKIVFRAGGEMIQCAVGQFDSSPQLEIAVCGMVKGGESGDGPGAVHVLGYHASIAAGWKVLARLEDTALVHGVCFHGDAVWSVGFSRRIHRCRAQGLGEMARHSPVTFEAIGRTPGHGKQIITTATGPAVACDDGSLCRVRLDGQNAETVVIDRRDAGRARLGAKGNWLAVADDDGTLALYQAERRDVVYRTPTGAKLRGAVVEDLDPEVDGDELATTGYDGKIILLTRSAAGWIPHEVGRDPQSLHHLAAGDVTHDGAPDLVAVGYSGKVLVVTRHTPP